MNERTPHARGSHVTCRDRTRGKPHYKNELRWKRHDMTEGGFAFYFRKNIINFPNITNTTPFGRWLLMNR